jgi:hypothetical protein
MRILAILFLVLQSGLAAAQVRSVEVRVPRGFGYFLGDLLQARVDIALEPGTTVQQASLPQPGPVTYWLDLRDVAVERMAEGLRLRLTYQTFYAALDARRLEVPGFTVSLADETPGGTTTARAEIPAWTFGVSPLREVQPEKRDDPADYLQPDGRARRLDPEPAATTALVFAGLAIPALALLAWDRAWLGRSRGRPSRPCRPSPAPDPRGGRGWLSGCPAPDPPRPRRDGRASPPRRRSPGLPRTAPRLPGREGRAGALLRGVPPSVLRPRGRGRPEGLALARAPGGGGPLRRR